MRLARIVAATWLMSSAAASAAVDCVWIDNYICLDRNTVSRSGTLAKATEYMCYSQLVGPPAGRCDEPHIVSIDCSDFASDANGKWKVAKSYPDEDMYIGDDAGRRVPVLCSSR